MPEKHVSTILKDEGVMLASDPLAEHFLSALRDELS